MSRFAEMQALVRAVEAGGVTQAAAQLGTVKSAVSRRLKELEARLGVQLLVRTSRGVRLTPEGETFFERARRILQDVAEADNEVSGDVGVLSGVVRIASPAGFGVDYLAPALLSFQVAHPRVRLEIDFDDRAVDLAARGLDLALRIGRLADSSLMARRLAPIRHFVAASPDYWNRAGRPRTAEDLAAHDLLLYGNVSPIEVLTYRGPDGTRGQVSMRTAMTANSGDFLCQAAMAGLGVVVEPGFILHAALARQERGGDARVWLETVLTDHVWSDMALHAVYPPTRHVSPRVRALIDHLVAHFAGDQPWNRPPT